MDLPRVDGSVLLRAGDRQVGRGGEAAIGLVCNLIEAAPPAEARMADDRVQVHRPDTYIRPRIRADARRGVGYRDDPVGRSRAVTFRAIRVVEVDVAGVIPER